MLSLGVALKVSPKCRFHASARAYHDSTVLNWPEALSTAPSRKLAMALPLAVPSKPVLSREKPKLPDPLNRSTRLIPSFRYSPPNLNVCLPRTQVNRSLTMYVGRDPRNSLLQPNDVKSLKDSTGGLLWSATP